MPGSGGSGRGSGGRGSTGGCVVFVCGTGAAAASVSAGGGGTMGKGGRIGSTLPTIGVEGTTGIVRAGGTESSSGLGLLAIGVDETTGVVSTAGTVPETGAGRMGTRGRQDGRPHVIG